MGIFNFFSRRNGKANENTNVLNKRLERDFRLGLWRQIYAGEPDWLYVKKGGISGGMRKLSLYNGARVVCAELANLCFSEQVDFALTDEKSKAFLHDVLHENDFFAQFPLFLEKTFALGIGAIKLSVVGGKIKLDFVNATDFELETNGSTQKANFFSRISHGNKRYLLVETHTFGDTYVVENKVFDEDSGREIPLAQVADCAQLKGLQECTEISGFDNPLFICFRPSGADNYTLDGDGHGISVFANAIDTLKSIDVVFDSLQREFVLGKKRIIVPTSAIRGEYDEHGDKRCYFDTSDEVFQAFSADDKEDLKIYDNSTTLRVDEHIKALEELLNILCSQVGLSAGSLSYTSNTARTATEVISQNNKSHRTRAMHQKMLAVGLKKLCENIILLGKAQGVLSEYADEAVEVSFEDSVITDQNAKLDNVIKLFDAGLIDRETALAKVSI